MGIKEDTLEKAQEIARWKLVELTDVPRIPLYMEQVTSFFDEVLAGARRNDDDKILTKTMINNYTKEGTLPRPNGKKYSRDHIIRLLYIFILKQVLSLQDVKEVFDLMGPESEANQLYTTYLELVEESKAQYLEKLEGRLDLVMSKLECSGQLTNENVELLLTLLTVTEATMGKMLIWRILDDAKEQRRADKEADGSKEKKQHAGA